MAEYSGAHGKNRTSEPRQHLARGWAKRIAIALFRGEALGVRRKGSAFDIVTDADEACEAALSAALQQVFPGVVVVGEEGTERQAWLLDSIASAPSAFVVDPLDGTKNFASRLPLFGIVVAGTPYLPSHTTGGLLCALDEASWLACRAALLDES
ncbi:inositol monophosphatase family protein [Variovorax sp. LT1R16]|uniref:inositol monophosphatase family protein n=1 Tax=Variovorax sp. LT1R16 TaxID=3443728 RepID=UPI003F45F803